MAFIDCFTPEAKVKTKAGEYFNLIKEAAFAELTENALKAGVPGKYVKAMRAGYIYDTETPEPETIKKDCDTWGNLAATIKDILNQFDTPEAIAEMAEAIQELTEDLAATKRRQVWIENRAAVQSKPAAETKEYTIDDILEENEG